MNHFFLIFAIILASLTTAYGNDAIPSSINATIYETVAPEYPHTFSFTNTGDDTLTIEFVVVNCAGITTTPVHFYIHTEPFIKHKTGSLDAVIRHEESIPPHTLRNLSFMFGVRIPSSAVTISVMVRDQLGKRYLICCTGGSL